MKHTTGVWRACGSAWRRGRGRALLLAAAALAALHTVRLPASLSSAHHFPAHAPNYIAHALADFSNQPDVTSWRVEEDHSNYTTWRYSVQFACGARCSGRADVLAHDEPAARAPQHGHAARLHRVSLARRSCSSMPLLPWPQLCDELELIAVIWGSVAEGAQLQEESRTRCSLLSWLSGGCARWLWVQRDLRLVRLRALNPALPAPQPA